MGVWNETFFPTPATVSGPRWLSLLLHCIHISAFASHPALTLLCSTFNIAVSLSGMARVAVADNAMVMSAVHFHHNILHSIIERICVSAAIFLDCHCRFMFGLVCSRFRLLLLFCLFGSGDTLCQMLSAHATGSRCHYMTHHCTLQIDCEREMHTSSRCYKSTLLAYARWVLQWHIVLFARVMHAIYVYSALRVSWKHLKCMSPGRI